MPARKPGTRKPATASTSSKVAKKTIKHTADSAQETDNKYLEKVKSETGDTLDYNADYHYGFPVIGRELGGLDALKRVFNVRSLQSEQKLDTLLKDSLQTNGLRNPIVVNRDFNILDGHRRLYHLHLLASEGVITPSHPVKILVVDVPDNEIAYYQYLTGIEKGHNEEEKQIAIFKFLQDNPDVSDREVARKFAVSNTTVSDISKVISAAPSLIPRLIARQINKTSAIKIVESARKIKKTPAEVAEVAEKVIANLVGKDKLPAGEDDQPLKPLPTSSVVKVVSELYPKFNAINEKGQTTPTAKKLLADLFLQLRPQGYPNKGLQDYSLTIDVSLVAQIETLLNVSETKVNTSKTYSVTEITEYTPSFEQLDLWRLYTGLTVSEESTVVLRGDDNWHFADENSEIIDNLLSTQIKRNRQFAAGIDWCTVKINDFSPEQLCELAQKHDLSLLIVNLVLVEDAEDDTPESEEEEEDKENEEEVTNINFSKLTSELGGDDDDTYNLETMLGELKQADDDDDFEFDEDEDYDDE
jgi:ParB-like chromosome segregation protein Spo0J